MKIILGTAQFGMKYGINNHDGILSDEKLKNLLIKAKQKQIIHLDTALDYGNAQKRLGKIGLKGFKFISKLKSLSSFENLQEKVNEILNQLNTKKIYALLFHSPSELIENPIIWSWFKELKNTHPDLKIGYSVYNIEELDYLLKIGIIPEIIQIPFNIFDHEFEDRFEQLVKLNIEIHVRSVFMQGLFFMDPDNLPYKVLGIKNELKQLNKICMKWNISVGHAALQFVANKKQISGVVIGIDSINQLDDNINFFSLPLPQQFCDELNKQFRNLDNPLKKINEWKKVKIPS